MAHIVRDSFSDPGVTEQEILDNFVILNEAFEPICAAFEVCEFNYINNFQYDTLQGNDWAEMQVRFNKNNRINMYFVTAVEGDAICGFATLGGITNLESGGIVILKGDCVGAGAKTLPHEMGHYFNLYHTFEADANGPSTVSEDEPECSNNGDLVCDTPADPFMVGDDVEDYVDVDLGCRFISPLTDSNGEAYVPDVGNYMSYYPDRCRCGFTYGQYVRMAEHYLSSIGMW
ncbi:MAG: M43 family zinc metalloprotease [Bacteroidota bacterium]